MESSILTPEEFAEKYKIGRTKLYEMLRAGKIPGAFKIGNTWRIDESVFRGAMIERGSKR